MKNVLEIALSQYGVQEIMGKQDNPTIVNYFKEIGHSWVKDDETAWCAAFVNWCLLKAGIKGTGKLNARSFEDWGNQVDTPQLGDIVVFWRVKPDSPYGHVAFYINEDENYIYALGGNQGNMVQVSRYPKYKWIGCRRG